MVNSQNQKNSFGFIKRLNALIQKELRIIVNDRFAMIIMFVIPIMVITLMVFGAQIVETPQIGLIDLDESDGFPNRDLSEELVAEFKQMNDIGECNLFISSNQSELEMMLGRGDLNSFIIIPEMFECNLSIHLPSIITVVFDSVDTMRLQKSQTIIEDVINEFRITNNFTGVFNIEKYEVNLPEKYLELYTSLPLIIPLLFFAIGSLVASQNVVGDIPKDRMVLTPSSKGEILATKVTANTLMMLLLAFLLMGISFALNLEFRCTYIELFIIFFLIILNSVIIGTFISIISKTSLSAFQYFIFVLLFQTIAVFFISDENITRWLPMEIGYVFVDSIVLRGQSFWSVRTYIFTYLIETILIYIIMYIVFKKQKNLL